MDCSDALHVIYHYLDGELNEEKRAAIADHLQFCPPCSGGFGFELELKSLIARCRDDVPPDLRRRIGEAIRHERFGPEPAGFDPLAPGPARPDPPPLGAGGPGR